MINWFIANCRITLERNNLLKDCQFGFRHKLAVTLFTDKIKEKVDKGKIVVAIFIDLSKAVDTLSHTKIITKLQSYGVYSIELKWFQDYLFNGTQFVNFGDVLSQGEGVKCGVPHGVNHWTTPVYSLL